MRIKLDFYIIFIGLLTFFSTTLFSDETLIKIAGDQNYKYIKPEVKIRPSGAIYIVYQADNVKAGVSDIYLSKYEKGEVSFVKNISDSISYSYEPEIDIAKNGDIHISWCDQSGENNLIKYIFFDGNNWSEVNTLGKVNSNGIEDLRIKVDSLGNVFIVFMDISTYKSTFISKYENTVSFENFPIKNRSKHPDVDADSDYVHITYQYKAVGEELYSIAYQRRPNTPGSNWESLIDLDVYGPAGVQKPRITLDSNKHPHIAFFSKATISDRRLNYKYWNGSEFTGLKTLSAENEYITYHFCDIYATNSNNMIATMQKGSWGGGSGVYYNWKINGEWSGYSLFSKSIGLRPTKQSIDLDPNSPSAALVFAEKDNGIYLIIKTRDEEIEPSKPIAQFSVSPQSGPAPLYVEFDGSGSYAKDNASIIKYDWNFGDSNIATGKTSSHTYKKKGSYIVSLTVTDSNNKTDTAQRSVDVLNTPPFAYFTVNPKSGLYPLNITFDAEKSEDSDGSIIKYKWDFGDDSEIKETDSKIPFSHIYKNKGHYIASLSVFDNDMDTSSYSQSIHVYGVEAPVNIKTEILENRTLFTINYINKLEWENNPLNIERGVEIVKYKIYKKKAKETNFQYIGERSIGNESYIDRIGKEKIRYNYKIVAYEKSGKNSDE